VAASVAASAGRGGATAPLMEGKLPRPLRYVMILRGLAPAEEAGAASAEEVVIATAEEISTTAPAEETAAAAEEVGVGGLGGRGMGHDGHDSLPFLGESGGLLPNAREAHKTSCTPGRSGELTLMAT
jgi:hypothetical protein